MASIKPEFERRGVKIIGLSIDPLDRHGDWVEDIEETQGYRPDYPIISDADYNVAKAYGMLASRSTATRSRGRRPTTRRCATSSSSGPTRRSS